MYQKNSMILFRAPEKCRGYPRKKENIRMQVLERVRLSSFMAGCDMEWYICSRDILQKNRINPYISADAIRHLLIHGRGKFRKVMITGPANCGKTFMLKPLEIIYNAFSSPANDKYAWVGADNAEVIILQDFRWSSELICWKDLLLLLEGEPVKLPCPKNLFETDVCIKHAHSKQLFAGHMYNACAETSDIFLMKGMTCARCRNQNNLFDLLFAVVVRN